MGNIVKCLAMQKVKASDQHKQEMYDYFFSFYKKNVGHRIPLPWH